MNDEISEIFDEFVNDYKKFDEVKKKLSQRADMHVLIFLDKKFSGKTRMIRCSEHDMYYLNIEPEDLIKNCTKEEIRNLVRAGLVYEDEFLCMRS